MSRYIAGLVPLVVLALVAGCGTDTGGPASGAGRPGAPIPSVEVVQAKMGSLPLRERLSGMVRAQNQVSVVSEISAPVERVVARNGDRVSAGDALAVLRDKQYQDQLRQAEAALQIARADQRRTEATLAELRTRLERTRQLAEKEFESTAGLELLEAQAAGAEAANEQTLARIAQAEATVEEQREALRRTVVRAPVSGVVGERNVEVGMRIDPGRPLFTVGDLSRIRVEVAVTDRMVGRIEPGQTALITVEGSTEPPIEAQVSRISPFLQEGTFTAAAEIDLVNPDGRLRPGMFVAVDVLYGESEQATVVPEAALFEDPNSGILGAFVATSLRTETPVEEPEEYDPDNPPPLVGPTPVSFQPLDVLARGDGLAGVSGIQAGDWVLTVGQHLIRSLDGTGQVLARPVPWTRVASLQRLQDRDLLLRFLEKQQRLARESFTDNGSAASK
jgi:RND family efflux transporter MFP subunit